MKTIGLLIPLCCVIVTSALAIDVPVGDALLRLDNSGRIHPLAFFDQMTSPAGKAQAFCSLTSAKGDFQPKAVQYSSNTLSVDFEEDSRAVFTVQPSAGFTLFHLTELDLKTSCTTMKLFQLPIPEGAAELGTLNGYTHSNKSVALMSGSPEIMASASRSGVISHDLAGCSHTFVQTTGAKVGKAAARFEAGNTTVKSNGWSMRGRRLSSALERKSLAGLSAWVHGDGKGEQLKFQLTDGAGSARDYYVPIDFTGWRKIEMTQPALDQLKSDSIVNLNLYYNGLPKQSNVVCLIDDIRALIVENETTRTISVEEFEDINSSWWSTTNAALNLNLDFRYAGEGTTFGIIACDSTEFFPAIERFEKAANILTPYPGGTWNKKSEAARENYLFLTSFKESQFDEAVALARRGGFKRILFGQESWCQSTGHYEIKKVHFPDGLPGMVRTMNRFREQGIEVGLHLLGASIDWNDPYLTPKPDPRLVKDAVTTLTKPLDAATTTIVVDAMPENFPAEDGGYTGDGTVLWIGDELIKYSSRTTTAPYTFSGCVRGHLGTTAAAHGADVPVHNLARSYGYHMFDMDTTLLDEVTDNFARVANVCNIDMVYFDGSERLQGDHGRYNARLINAYLQKLKRKDILVQASSFSHFSWHQLARSASADGHGDLKGYLEQRSPAFDHFKKIGMPLDIGWYYGYDTSATPDMYEYILGTTIGYDSSFSYQVSVARANEHPFTGRILDMVKEYEQLRLEGKVSAEMRERLQVPKELMGKAPDDASRPTHLRRDYHLTEIDGKRVFQRVVYGKWQAGGSTSSTLRWKVEVTTGPAVVCIELQALEGDADGQTLKAPWIDIAGERFEWEGDLQAGQYLMMEAGDNVAIYGVPLKEPRKLDIITPKLALKSGSYDAKFGCAEGSALPFRVRINLLPPEQWIVDDSPLKPEAQ